MAIRQYKPTTPGRRNASVSDFSEITRSTPEKSLLRKLSKTGGRNSYGRMTSRHRGGGHKRQYRLIDFKRWDKDGVPAKVAEIEYDPNRSARIALLHYADGEKRYIIAPQGVRQILLRQVHRQISSPATTCLCVTSPQVLLSMPLSSAPLAVLRLHALQVPLSSSLQKMALWPSCACLQAKSAMLMPGAVQPLAKSVIPTMPILSLARQAAPGGWASAQ